MFARCACDGAMNYSRQIPAPVPYRRASARARCLSVRARQDRREGRVANTIRSEQFPKGKPSLDAAALVRSKAPTIIGAHDTGPLIRSKSGFWLAIPTPAAGKSLRGGRVTPGEWERRHGLRLRFVYRRRGPSLLVVEGPAEHQGPRGGVALEDRPRANHGSDLPAGAAGEADEAAGPRAGCRAGVGQRAGADRGELDRGEGVSLSPTVNTQLRADGERPVSPLFRRRTDKEKHSRCHRMR